jgi:hypothetical protein
MPKIFRILNDSVYLIEIQLPFRNMDLNILISSVGLIFTLLVIILILILAIVSIFILFYYGIRETIWKRGKNDDIDKLLKTYERWPVDKLQTRIELLNRFVIVEFFCFFSILLIGIWMNHVSLSPEMFQIQNIKAYFYNTISYNLTCPNSTCIFSSGVSFSLEKFSIVIGLMSGLVVYTYFFEMLGEIKLSKKINETQKKYFGFFGNMWVFTAFYTLFVLTLDVIKMDFNFEKQIIPLIVGWINVVVLIPLPFFYQKNCEKYKFIEDFNKSRVPDEYRSLSSYIFISTILLTYLGYSLGFDIFVLIFLEITLLLIHLWTSRFLNLPNEKCTIELNKKQENPETPEILENVYIIEEFEDSYIIVTPKEKKVIIMKSSINQIIKIT